MNEFNKVDPNRNTAKLNQVSPDQNSAELSLTRIWSRRCDQIRWSHSQPKYGRTWAVGLTQNFSELDQVGPWKNSTKSALTEIQLNTIESTPMTQL